MSYKRLSQFAVPILYGCATLQFIRFYVLNTTFYLNLPAYLRGQERLPFQERVLPAVLMRLFYASPLLRLTSGHVKGAFTPERAPFFLLSLVSLLIAGVFVQRLYRSVTASGALWFLVYPVFLFAMMWTYAIHSEANFSYPYDMPAVAFFSAGLYSIYSRRYLLLLAVVVLGTFNRETTLFLIGIYLLDATASTDNKRASRGFAPSVLHTFPLLRVSLLVVVWLAIKLTLAHVFALNDHAEDYVRLRENFASLQPRLWPALLNICGYLLPVVVLRNRELTDRRFRSYLWIVPFWFAVMFYKGVILETRIYGELCPYVAVALVLILEHRVAMAHRIVSQSAQEQMPALKIAA